MLCFDWSVPNFESRYIIFDVFTCKSEKLPLGDRHTSDKFVIHHAGEKPLWELHKFFKMKKGSKDDPDFYLGSKLKWTVLPNGVVAWGMSSSKYAQEVVKNVEEHLSKMDMTIKRNIVHHSQKITSQNWMCHQYSHHLMPITTNPRSEFRDGWWSLDVWT